MKHAVVLLSGGLDSSTTLAVALREGFECHALTVSYGQRHDTELRAAKNVVRMLGARDHKVISVPLDAFGGSSLTDKRIPVPKGRASQEIEQGIPSTYVPARNTVLLALALAYAESLGASDIFLGVNAVDYSGYPDCRPEFIQAFEQLANVATKVGVEGAEFHIRAPLISLAKPDIIRLGLELGVDYSLTFTCYDPTPDGRACGRCDACLIRSRAFAEVGLSDPALARVAHG
ncbi:MAG: 7-cyano-7-deazaguanine synthase QueC [Armatimonadetes bacterium]|nr:7-cyano-7-deazaguanine synthase QueC [Armatimonadota bacterium]